MTPEQIAAMIADREAGTPGPWKVKFRKDGSAYMSMGGDRPGDAHSRFSIGLDSQYPSDVTNARRISRVPDMEATIIAQAAELATLREAMGNNCNALTAADRAYLIAHLSYELEPVGKPPTWNQLAMEVIRLSNAIAALKGGA